MMIPIIASTRPALRDCLPRTRLAFTRGSAGGLFRSMTMRLRVLMLDVLVRSFHAKSSASFQKRKHNSQSQVFRFESSVFGNSRQHLWANLILVVKSKDYIRPAGTEKNFMRTG